MHPLGYYALRIETAGKKHEKDVLNAISNCGIGSLCYAFKTRVKGEAKLLEKYERKLKEKPKYLLESITDVIGLRLITLFRNEIPQILREIVLLVKHAKQLQPNPFFKDTFEEVIIYTNAPTYDPFLTELQNVLAEEGVSCKLAESKEGYSSVHIVTRLNYYINNGDKDTHRVPVEVQIRSVFEDAWGEIDHRFGYVMRAGKESTNDNLSYNSSVVQPHLKVLKQFTDACAQYADTIYEAAHTPLTVQDGASKIASVPSDDKVLYRFRSLGVPEKFIEKYIEGRKLREAALELASKNRTQGQTECVKAASFFLATFQSIDGAEEFENQQGKDLYTFYVRMNEGLCLLSTDSPQHVKIAEGMYLKLREQFPGYLLVGFRLGQTLAKLGEIDGAILQFSSTNQEVRRTADLCNQSRNWPDELPETDYIHIRALLPKLLGYQYWKKSQQTQKIGERRQLLLNAIDATMEALTSDPMDKNIHNIHNNLVYYAQEYLAAQFETANSDTKRIARILHASLVKLEIYLKEHKSLQDISLMETMMQAYNVLGKTSLAQHYSSRILGLATELKDGSAEETLEIIQAALEMQALQGPENLTVDTSSD